MPGLRPEPGSTELPVKAKPSRILPDRIANSDHRGQSKAIDWEPLGEDILIGGHFTKTQASQLLGKQLNLTKA
ncbi:MAG: hypothetical protein KDD64_03495 [Bdellovibrionales bacterium]|nr:hypothetical protein [Bdellovibrionales bacterium]